MGPHALTEGAAAWAERAYTYRAFRFCFPEPRGRLVPSEAPASHQSSNAVCRSGRVRSPHAPHPSSIERG